MRFYTTQHRLGRGTDVTWRAKHLFSPTYDLVRAYKESRIDWDTYREKYLNLLRIRYSADPEKFVQTVKPNEIFMCFCNPKDHCHRQILAGVLTKLGHEYGGEI